MKIFKIVEKLINTSNEYLLLARRCCAAGNLIDAEKYVAIAQVLTDLAAEINTEAQKELVH